MTVALNQLFRLNYLNPFKLFLALWLKLKCQSGYETAIHFFVSRFLHIFMQL